MSYEHKDKDKRAIFEAAHQAALKRAKEKAGDHGEHKGDHKWGINLVPFSQRVGSIKRFSALSGPIATYDLLNPVAGAGQRDLWADGSATGSLVWYIAATDFLYVMDPYNPTTSTTQYSNDGGGTWTTIAYSGGSPTNKGSITGYDGSGNYCALPAGAGDASYKSTDGKTFTKQNAFPGSNGPMSSNVIWYAKNSLFVCCSIIDATHVICTSSDSGATFVQQSTPSIGTIVPITTFMSLATDGNTIVAALGNVSQNPVIYSTDGTTWSTVSGGPANGDVAVAVSYSSTKGWFLQNSTDGTGYTSSNGTTWTKQASGWGAAGAISSFWSPEYSMWYMVNTDPDNDLNYTLLATPDPTQYPFQPTSLDGARPAPLGYNLGCYMPKYDSFVIGTSDTGGVAGSTSRPRTIKSVGDDIRVRNMPVSCGTYSTYTSKSANSTTTEVTLSNPTSALGSLSFQADQPLGSVIDLDFYCNVTSSAGDTLTLRYKNNGSTMFTHALTIPSSSSNLGINIRTRMTVASGDIQYNSTATISGSAATILSGTNSWTQQPNTISITGQWGAAASSCTMNQLICTTHFPNGA